VPDRRLFNFVIDKFSDFCFPNRGMKAKPSSKTTGRSASATGGTTLTARVIRADERKRFDDLLDAKHYLGQTPSVGDFLRQVVERDGEWIALFAWGPACLHLKDRDKWIGWNRLHRAERLKLIAQNRRYLLLTERGKEPNLASQVLALATRALPKHWQDRFGYQPVMAESFTDIELFHGTCYRACGWEAVGQSAGYSRHRADFYIKNDRPKKLWMKLLCPDAKAILCGASLAEEHTQAETPATGGVLPLSSGQMRSLLEVLFKVKDPRGKNTRFKVPSVLVIVAMALLCGKRDISQFHRFGWRLRQDQRALIRLPVKKGNRKIREIPGYNVYYQLLSRLDLDAFAGVLNEWLKQRNGELPGALAVDGKMIRDCVGVVTMADHDTGIPHSAAIMSQKEGEGADCEMMVAQKLVEKSGGLASKVVTGDALHAQRKTSRQIVEHGGEYLLQVKNNQQTVFKLASSTFEDATPFLP
jgi:hypothetical protein